MDEKTNQFSGFKASRADHFLIVILELFLDGVQELEWAPYFHDGAEKLKPVPTQVKPILPVLDDFLVLVFGAEDGLNDEVWVVEQVVQRGESLARQQEQICEHRILTLNFALRH